MSLNRFVFYLITPSNNDWSNIPENILTNKSKRIIFIVSFMLSFFLISTSKPSPALEHNPEITDPKPIAPFIYITVIATDAAQFGINPTNAVIIG